MSPVARSVGWSVFILFACGACRFGEKQVPQAQTARPSSGSTRNPGTAASSIPGFEPGVREMLDEMNLLRADPPSYARKIRSVRSYYQDRMLRIPGETAIQLQEGESAVDEAIAALEAATPARSLSLSVGMTRAALDHASDLGRTGTAGHAGSDGSDVAVRLERHGKWLRAAGENIAFGVAPGQWVVIGLLVDDGVPSRGHRKNLLEPSFGAVGIACAPHRKLDPVCVIDFAGGYQEATP